MMGNLDILCYEGAAEALAIFSKSKMLVRQGGHGITLADNQKPPCRYFQPGPLAAAS
jgi:hypothetical protein